MSQAVTNFKNTRGNLTDAWIFYGEGTHNVNFWYKGFTILCLLFSAIAWRWWIKLLCQYKSTCTE